MRRIDNLSLTNLGKFLKRNPSGLITLAHSLERKIAKNSLIANDVNQVLEWLAESLKERISESQARPRSLCDPLCDPIMT